MACLVILHKVDTCILLHLDDVMDVSCFISTFFLGYCTHSRGSPLSRWEGANPDGIARSLEVGDGGSGLMY